MTGLMQQTWEQISQLSEDKQNHLAVYIQNHLHELLQQVENELMINQGNYTIDDCNDATQQSIKNVEENHNLTICENQNDLYHQLGI